MASQTSKRPNPDPKALPPASKEQPEQAQPASRLVFGRALPGGVYKAAVAPLLGNQADKVPDPSGYAQAVIADMAPRDAAEEMLIAQMLFAHARAMRLTHLANLQNDIASIRVLHEYADRASGTYRKLMLALAEYRRPARTGDTFAVVKQTNIAGQQVIQNHEKSTAISTNEQGFSPATGGGRATVAATPTLPPDSGGAGGPAFLSEARRALEAVHRPQVT